MKLYDGREKFYQYDTNQKLICEDCSVGEEVHFSNGAHSDAAICLTYDLDGTVVVNVPNLYLLSASELNVYSMRTEDDGRCTISRHVFGVVPRKKPSDYVYEETEVKSYAELDRRIKKLEENDGAGIDIVGAEAGQIPQIADVDENGVPTAWQPADLPSGGTPPLVVNLSVKDGGWVADRTRSEIIAHVEKGGSACVAVFGTVNAHYWQATATSAIFRRAGANPTRGGYEQFYYIDEAGVCTTKEQTYLLTTMAGATADAAGAAGVVPAPAAGDEGKFLRGDGTWGDIDIPDGGGGGGTTDHTLGISGAAVGQIAKITAVDGNGVPTAWESVYLPSGGGVWEKLNEFTLEENALTVLIDTDADGKSFALKEMLLIMNLPKCKNTAGEDAGTGYIDYRINGNGLYSYFSSDWDNGIFIFRIEAFGNKMIVEAAKQSKYNNAGNGAEALRHTWHRQIYKYDSYDGTIKSFLWSVFGPNANKPSAMAGATFEVWGVRA